MAAFVTKSFEPRGPVPATRAVVDFAAALHPLPTRRRRTRGCRAVTGPAAGSRSDRRPEGASPPLSPGQIKSLLRRFAGGRSAGRGASGRGIPAS